MIGTQTRPDGVSQQRSRMLHNAARYLLAALGCAVVTAVTTPVREVLEPANIVMLFLLVVLGAALWLGRGPAVVAAFIGVGLFDFFFVPPRLTFAVSNWSSLITFAVMLAVGLVTADLVARLRGQVSIAEARGRESEILYALARRLAAANSIEKVRAALNTYFEPLGCEADFHLLSAQGEFGSLKEHPVALRLALMALKTNEPVDLTLSEPEFAHAFVPLRAPMQALGVVALHMQAGHVLPLPQQRERLRTGAALAALALERLAAPESAS